MLIQQLVNGISIGGIYALIASGYSLIYSLLNFSNWAHGEVAMLGACFALYAVTLLPLPLYAAVAVAILGAGVVSIMNERLFYRRIRENKAPTTFLMIAAMGLSTIFSSAAKVFFGVKSKAFPIMMEVSYISIGNITVDIYDVISLAVAMIALIVLEVLINQTKFGLGVRAVAISSYTSSLLGINVDKILMRVFFLAGGLAGAAGFLLGIKYNVSPSLGSIGTKAFVASVFGGLGSIKGAIVGAVLLGIIETLCAGYISSGLKDLMTFVLLIAILLIKPTGLMGRSIKEKV